MRVMHEVPATKVNPDSPELAAFIEGATKIKQDDHDQKFPRQWWATPPHMTGVSPEGGCWSPRTVYRLALDWAPKYLRVWVMERTECDDSYYVRAEHCSYIYAFIDRFTGDILKPASTKAPAKHARGNIFTDDNGLSCVNWYGPKYMSDL